MAHLRAERAGLQTLRYQLNPHLLFNALASIRGAIAADPQAAWEMVGVLSEYCRLTLDRGRRDVLPLSEELDMARLFLRMDQARQLQPVEVTWQIAPDIADCRVPAFVLQPLVENAVKFGRRTSGEGGVELRIAASATEPEGVSLRVSNTGTWASPEAPENGSGGVGLDNIRRRLAHYFGPGDRVAVEHGGGWVHVSVHLPVPASTP